MLHTTLIVRHTTQVYSSRYLSANNFEMLLESVIPSTVLLLLAEWDLMCLISDQKLRLLLFNMDSYNPVPYNLYFIFPYSPYDIMISSPAATHTVSHRASIGASHSTTSLCQKIDFSLRGWTCSDHPGAHLLCFRLQVCGITESAAWEHALLISVAYLLTALIWLLSQHEPSDVMMNSRTSQLAEMFDGIWSI